MAVIDANDRKIGRVHYCDRGEGTDIHQQFAVTGHDQDPLVGTCERKAEPDHASAAHGTGHRVGVRSILRQRRDIAAGAGEPADNQKIVVSADQGRDRIAPVEDEIRSDSGRRFPFDRHQCLLACLGAFAGLTIAEVTKTALRRAVFG
jgi:hypothetical protein